MHSEWWYLLYSVPIGERFDVYNISCNCFFKLCSALFTSKTSWLKGFTYLSTNSICSLRGNILNIIVTIFFEIV